MIVVATFTNGIVREKRARADFFSTLNESQEGKPNHREGRDRQTTCTPPPPSGFEPDFACKLLAAKILQEKQIKIHHEWHR